MNIFNMPVSEIKGIGPKRAELFQKLNMNSVYDIIYHFPYKYQDRSVFYDISDIGFGTECSVKCRAITIPKTVYPKRNMSITVCNMADETGEIKAVWYNQPYISKTLQKGKDYVLYGKFNKKGSLVEISNPVIEKAENSGKFTGKIVPQYSLCSGLSQGTFEKTVSEALNISEKLLVENLPEVIVKKYDLLNLTEALKQIHFPTSFDSLLKARQRFVFEQYFMLFMMLGKLRKGEAKEGIFYNNLDSNAFRQKLPFELTSSQIKVLNEIKEDILNKKQVKRLIQGDVGAGKTVVAVEMLYLSALNGFQSAIMAPTEVLARQHYLNIKKMLPDLNVKILTSSIKKKEKTDILQQLLSGEIDIIIGTHAIIEDNVKFFNLGLVVCDEQHRFGVRQRQKLIEKGNNPHLIVMTATPIPRTLSLILYGDLDVSIIDELPPGRKEIKTYLVNESLRQRVYKFLKDHLNDGQQAYIVCPLVDESETLDLKDVINFSEYIKTLLPEYNIGLMHGKLKDNEKNEIMQDFKDKKTNVLVSTTVIEVGVDVPNSTIMIIENAERFGLSQLHQLRGRVGRSDKQSYCIMFANTKNNDTLERLRVIEKSTDGFYISEQDLKMRGPGDFIGTRQSGIPYLTNIDGEADIKLIYNAKSSAELVLKGNKSIKPNESEYIDYLLNSKYDADANYNILN